jgi:hypothetical protein
VSVAARAAASRSKTAKSSAVCSATLPPSPRSSADRAAVTFAICDAADRCLGHVFVNLSTSQRRTSATGFYPGPEEAVPDRRCDRRGRPSSRCTECDQRPRVAVVVGELRRAAAMGARGLSPRHPCARAEIAGSARATGAGAAAADRAGASSLQDARQVRPDRRTGDREGGIAGAGAGLAAAAELDAGLQVPLGVLDRAVWLDRLARQLARRPDNTGADRA